VAQTNDVNKKIGRYFFILVFVSLLLSSPKAALAQPFSTTWQYTNPFPAITSPSISNYGIIQTGIIQPGVIEPGVIQPPGGEIPPWNP
jgi:hypothetical protein